jgi:hypothetical protein
MEPTMNRSIRFAHVVLSFLVSIAAICSSETFAVELVSNGDFELEAEEFIVWPGYVGGSNEAGDMNPAEIPEWLGTGGRGINPVFAPSNPADIVGWSGAGQRGINPIANGDAPFRDNGDNDTVAAFLQGIAEIRQDISGLSVGTNYTLTFDFNARNCCGDMPVGTFSLNDVPIPLDDFSDAIAPVGGSEPWYQTEFTFPAPESDLSIAFSAEPTMVAGDATLLLDNIQLVAEGSPENLITNGDFESEADAFDIWPGYVGGPGGANSPFRDNGDNTTSVAFLQGAASLSQIVSGLDEGGVYVLSLDFNARTVTDVPVAELLVDGFPVEDFPGNGLDDGAVFPVGGTEPWYHFETLLFPEQEAMEITVNTFPESGGDSTLLIDNVSVAPLSAPGDFNADGAFDQQDLDLLVMEISAGPGDSQFDMNSDGTVDRDDIEQWLSDGAVANGLNSPYLWGDSNLDLTVNAGDLNNMAVNWQGSPNSWTGGDFDASGIVDAGDLNLLALSWQQSNAAAAGADVVPEPATGWICLLALASILGRWRMGRTLCS